MSYQFIHLECYSKKASTHKNCKQNKQNIRGVIAEARREKGNHRHIEIPHDPILHYGYTLDLVEDMVNEWIRKKKDSKGRKLRADAPAMLTGVFSFPEGRDQDWSAYRNAVKAFLLQEWGDRLVNITEHTDEKFKHCHFTVMPKSDEDFDDIHPARKAGKDYKREMEAFQEKFYQQVAIKFGLLKTGPKRERLTRKEWKARKETAIELASNIKNIESKKQATEIAFQRNKKTLEKTAAIYEEAKTMENEVSSSKIIRYLSAITDHLGRSITAIKSIVIFPVLRSKIEEAKKPLVDKIFEWKDYHDRMMKEKDRDIKRQAETISFQSSQIKSLKIELEGLRNEIKRDDPNNPQCNPSWNAPDPFGK